MDAEQLADEWFEALALLKPVITKDELRHLAVDSKLEFTDRTGPNLAYFRLRPGSSVKAQGLEVVVRPVLKSFHKIERIEALGWMACVGHVWFTQQSSWSTVDPHDAHRIMCKHVGVACSSSITPSTRWLQLGLTTTPQDALLEHGWPSQCIICSNPINSDEPEEAVHANCRYYAVKQAEQYRAFTLHNATESAS